MNLYFDREKQRLCLTEMRVWGLHTIDSFPAANNVDSRSKGQWPEGVFPFQGFKIKGDEQYGPGIIFFAVPGRSGMGIHGGRAEDPDGLGREGFLHATYGCIRTVDEIVPNLIDLARQGKIKRLIVVG